MRAVLSLLAAALLVAAIGCGAGGRAPGLASEARPLPAAAHEPSPVAGGRGGPQAMGEPVDESQLRVLFVGASVTQGWFASTRQTAYPSIVVRHFTSEGRRVQVRVLARPGATAEEAESWDLDGRADIVVLQMATNDFFHDVPPEVFSAAYANMVQRLRVASPDAELICMGGWDNPAQVNRLGIPASEYDVRAHSVCDSVGGRYADLSAAFLDARNHGPAGRTTYLGPGDNFHPNDRGHEALASLVLGDAGPRLPATTTTVRAAGGGA
jgi:lysophospholipase L1-like esterase